MVTWDELKWQALLESGYTTPVSWFTDPIALVYASKAQHLIQQETSACKRYHTIDLAADLDADGADAWPLDFKMCDTLTWKPDSATAGHKEVKIVTTDQFNQLIEGWRVDIGQPRLPQNDGQIYAKIENRKIYFFPFDGVTGIVTMRYIPHLSVYSPGNPVWEDFGEEPTTEMQTTGPEPDLQAAHWGIVEYMKAHIYRMSPGGLKNRMIEYQDAMSNFRQAVESLRSDTVDYSASTVVPSYFGGTQ